MGKKKRGNALKNVSQLGKAISISILNQGVSSATNFAFGLYLVRCMAPVDFGIYGIGFALSLFIAGIGNSIFLTQMVVNYNEKGPDDRRSYLCRMFVGLAFCCTSTTIILFALLFALLLMQVVGYEAINLWLSVMAASIGFLLKDFFIRLTYTERQERLALAINIVVGISILITSYLQNSITSQVTASTALFIYGASNFLGFIWGYYITNLNVHDLKFQQVRDDVREAWFGGGGWYLLITCANAIQTQAHTIVGAIWLGPIGVATMNAARLLLTPPLVLLPALNQVLLPRMVEKRSENPADLSKTGWKISQLLTGLTLLYIAMLIPAIDWIAEFVIKSEYADLKMTAYGWCIAVLFIAIRSGLALENHAKKEFKKFFFATLFAGVVGIFAAWALIVSFGPIGGPIGLGIGELALAIGLISWGRFSPLKNK